MIAADATNAGDGGRGDEEEEEKKKPNSSDVCKSPRSVRERGKYAKSFKGLEGPNANHLELKQDITNRILGVH